MKNKTGIVVVVYGNGDSKKHSVRFEAVKAEDAAIDEIGDIYISRKILDVLGAKDSSQIKVTFELEAD